MEWSSCNSCINDLQRELEKIGADIALEPYGQGFKDMAPAVDKVERVIAEKLLRHGGNPLLSMCAANTVVVRDPAGNRKLDKSKSAGRIDGLQAMAMALVAVDKFEPEQVPQWIRELNVYIEI